MALVPFRYTARSLFVRLSATLLTVFGIAATVAVVASILSLQQGFARLFEDSGRPDVYVFLRPGSSSEGLSGFTRRGSDHLLKSLPEVATDDAGQPLAAAECFLAVRREKVGGGETNVAIRGVQPASFTISGSRLRILEGRRARDGADEVIVGRKLVDRIENCRVGETIVLNTTPFVVTGIFSDGGPSESEIWGDADRIMSALERPTFNRIVARLKPDVDIEAFVERMEVDPIQPAAVQSEEEYYARQVGTITVALIFLASLLGAIMGVAAIFTATNTMLAAVGARTHEIGILLSIGFGPLAVFLSFLFEALLLGLIGGVIGAAIVLPLNGVETGTANFDSFTEVAFAFRISGFVLGTAILFATGLGLIGGLIPAWRASRLLPTEAMRRG